MKDIIKLRKYATLLGIKNSRKIKRDALEILIIEKEQMFNEKINNPKTINLDKMNLNELQTIAKEFNIQTGNINKPILIKQIKICNNNLPIYKIEETIITQEQIDSCTYDDLLKLIPKNAPGKKSCKTKESIKELANQYCSMTDEDKLQKLIEDKVDIKDYPLDMLHLHAKNFGIDNIWQRTRQNIEEIIGEESINFI